MYCINCGVELAAHEVKCPLCGTPVVNPDFIKPEQPTPYPRQRETHPEMNRSGVLFVLTGLFLLPILLTLVCDISINGTMVWSGYPIGALVLGYVVVVLPLWFNKPNPVIFVPVSFLAIIAFLFYINFATGGNWFLSFAMPLVAMLAIIVCAVVTLFRYVKNCALYTLGGASILLGGLAVATELLLNNTFFGHIGLTWSFYPLIVFVLLGLMLIVIAICKPLQESLRRKFFL